MKRAAIALAAVLSLSAAPQQEKPSIVWAKSWENALAEATARNVPIYLTIHKDG
jgi:hypothetical protein